VETQKFDVGEAIRFGWETTKANLNLVVVLTLLGALASGLPSIVADRVVGGSPGLDALLNLIGGIISLVVSIGAIRISLRLHDGGSAAVRDLFAADGPMVWRYFLATLLYFLVVAVGLILLVIPSIILSVRCAFYGYAVVEQNASPVEALAQSAAAARGAWWTVSLFGFVCLLLLLLGALLLYRLDDRLDMFAGFWSTASGKHTLHYDQVYVGVAFHRPRRKLEANSRI